MHTTSIWTPCSGCPCPNHHLPSGIFTVEPSLSDDPEWMHLARSNNPPSQHEETVLSGMISTHDQHIKDIDTEKSNLEAFSLSLKAQIVAVSQRMDALRQERARATEAVREGQNLLSPVRRLPSEILNHIFLDTIDFPVPRMQITREEEEGLEAAALRIWKFESTESSLWSVTGVSKQWRSASLSSPRLWSYINIIITESNFDDHSYIRQLGLQLDRSTKHPLSISICRVVRGSERIALPPQLVAILFSFSSCIRELHLYLDEYLLSQMSNMRLSLPSLEYLVLLCQSLNGIFGPTSPHLRLFSSTPKLQSLEVIDWKDGFEIPWNQVKKYHNDHRYIPTPNFFSLSGPRAHHHLNALRKFQQVEECTLRLSGVSDTLDLGGDVYPLICPQLRVLDLSSWTIDRTPSAFQQVADRLVLPRLSILKVACSQKDSYERQEVFSSICRLLQRSQSPITVLHFDHGRVHTEDLLQLFCSTPTLEDLRLTRLGDIVFTKEVMAKLTVDHASSEDLVLPHLCTLYISGGGDILSLVRMVQSRRSGGHSCRITRLQTLRVCGNFPDLCPGIDAIISHLKQYYAEGFSFDVCRTVL
ncbi:uncharacterized protein EV420DRAFT_1524477 [Desarmillaria tabescens]|uniref:F-box domain-containing protein n=1 Tax=Armillaria tabescens TaxID=1929756 RepID=A0AA39NBA7_ARMTA|nr:uncharacterized protein EV420DRAFT_1524477 [Desarmillaria tabescens]KAK0462394.1 hypothetical protein EV420DRAFT_1524477 [Desarmillaria tabescens]